MLTMPRKKKAQSTTLNFNTQDIPSSPDCIDERAASQPRILRFHDQETSLQPNPCFQDNSETIQFHTLVKLPTSSKTINNRDSGLLQSEKETVIKKKASWTELKMFKLKPTDSK